jgi:capsular exopolysaccharide synthesis family protein
MDLGWLLAVPRRRWKLILAIPLLCLLAAQGIYKLLTPAYQSSVEILMYEPLQRDPSVVGQQEHTAWDFDTLAMNTEMEVIRSESMLRRVVKDLRLDQDPEFQVHDRFAWLKERLAPLRAWIEARLRGFLDPTGPDATAVPTETAQRDDASTAEDEKTAQAVAILREHVNVQRATLAYILIVSARSRSPRMAQQLASQVVDDYFADQQKARQKAMDQLAIWLSAKIAELKGRSIETESAIEKLKAANGFGDKGGDSAIERQMTELNNQLMATRADAADKRARLEQARQLSANVTARDAPDPVTSPVLSQLRLQQSVLTQQQAQLRDKFGAGHASVAAITTQLAGISQAITDEAARIRVDLQSGYDLDIRREQSLDADLQRLTAARGDSSDHVKLQELQRTADADNRIYDAYLSRYNQIEASKSLVDSSERVISQAALPTQPVFPPRRGVIFAGAGVLGLMLSLMLAVTLEYFQLGMKMGAEAEQAFGYPVIGNVPLFRPARRGRLADGRTLVQTVVSAPLSPFSEAVRTIRLGLRLANPDDNPKVIVVTSSLPGEGKSTIATLLAASSAAAGHRTMLVDCDVRGRGVSRDFGTQQAGLTDFLSGNADLATVTLHPSDLGCAVIPAGTIMRSPGDLLASRRMSELMTRLRRDYDFVVVDTPPLLSVVDALALASMADKILVTVDGRNTRQVSVAEAFRLLRPETQRIAGIVFNKVEPEQLRRYGMYPDSRYYT